jgi:hypothetical protein
VSVNEVGWDKGDNQPADNHRVSCANGNANHLLGTGFYIHKGIISAVKTVEFISGRMSYIGLWCDITVLSAHAPTEIKVMIQRIAFMRNWSVYWISSRCTT